MKLPAGKKERLQVLVLIGMGVIVLLIVIVQFVFIPILASRKALAEKRDDYMGQLSKARRELTASPQIQAEFDGVTGRLQGIASNYLLHPILGSYIVGITESLEPYGRDSGFTIEDVQERGVQAIRLSAKDTGVRPYNAYSFQIAGQGSLDQVVAFLRIVEQRNPYLCLTELRISAQSDSPLRHRVSMRLEWPLEVEPAAEPAAAGKGGR